MIFFALSFYSTYLLVLLSLPKEKINDYGKNNDSIRSGRLRRPSRTWLYYVDKTNYIPGLEDYNAPVFLRPCRFGKSLLISTLAHYYDRTKANRFEELFGGTWIGEHPTKEHNQYMVIRYDFSAMVMANDMEGLAQNFNKLNCIPVESNVRTQP